MKSFLLLSLVTLPAWALPYDNDYRAIRETAQAHATLHGKTIERLERKIEEETNPKKLIELQNQLVENQTEKARWESKLETLNQAESKFDLKTTLAELSSSGSVAQEIADARKELSAVQKDFSKARVAFVRAAGQPNFELTSLSDEETPAGHYASRLEALTSAKEKVAIAEGRRDALQALVANARGPAVSIGPVPDAAYQDLVDALRARGRSDLIPTLEQICIDRKGSELTAYMFGSAGGYVAPRTGSEQYYAKREIVEVLTRYKKSGSRVLPEASASSHL